MSIFKVVFILFFLMPYKNSLISGLNYSAFIIYKVILFPVIPNQIGIFICFSTRRSCFLTILSYFPVLIIFFCVRNIFVKKTNRNTHYAVIITRDIFNKRNFYCIIIVVFFKRFFSTELYNIRLRH